MKRVVLLMVICLCAYSYAKVVTGRTERIERDVVPTHETQEVSRLEFYPTISYQGLLKDSEGKLIADGSYSLTFSVYDAEEAKEKIWKEVQIVEIKNGIVNCYVGAVEKLNLPFDKQYWLSVSIGEEELPRMIMGGTPYSLHARRIAEDAIVAGKNISVSTAEDGKLRISGSSDLKDASGEIYNLEDDDYDGIKMLTCETDLWSTYYGNHSVALGYKAVACGDRSFAAGDSSRAKADYSTSIGYHNFAESKGSVALGYNTYSNGWYATAMGCLTKASGVASMALGYDTEAKGYESFVYGYDAKSDSSHSYTFGNNVRNTFPTSFVLGINPGADSLDYQLFANRSFVSVGYTESENRSIDSCSAIPSKSFLVNGSVYAKAFKLKTIAWADYVFKDDYNLRPLSEVEEHIKRKGHLPGVMSEKDALADDIDVGDVQVKLLEKIEELTLYLIEQDKRIKELEKIK